MFVELKLVKSLSGGRGKSSVQMKALFALDKDRLNTLKTLSSDRICKDQVLHFGQFTFVYRIIPACITIVLVHFKLKERTPNKTIV